MKKSELYSSDFLFADTNFLIGMGSVLNLAGNYYEFASSVNEWEADAKALRNDWGMVGVDLKEASKKIKGQKKIAKQAELF